MAEGAEAAKDKIFSRVLGFAGAGSSISGVALDNSVVRTMRAAQQRNAADAASSIATIQVGLGRSRLTARRRERRARAAPYRSRRQQPGKSQPKPAVPPPSKPELSERGASASLAVAAVPVKEVPADT